MAATSLEHFLIVLPGLATIGCGWSLVPVECAQLIRVELADAGGGQRRCPKTTQSQISKRWSETATILGIAVVPVIVFIGFGTLPTLQYEEVNADDLQNMLFPLFLITVFKERAQEVYVVAWREQRRIELERVFQDAEEAEKPEKERELRGYRAQTGRYVSLASMSAGVLISLAGVRVLSPLVKASPANGGLQELLLFVVDVRLTRGLLAGGSKLIHEVMSVVSKALAMTKGRIASAAKDEPPPPGPTPDPTTLKEPTTS